MPMTNPILVIDDDASMCELLADSLRPHGFDVTYTTKPEEAEGLIKARQFDAVLTDIRMRGIDGLELCTRLVALRRDLPVIVVTAFGSLETAVAAIRAGAYDFLTKPVDADVAALALKRAVRHRELEIEVTELKRAAADAESYGDLVGASPEMQHVYELVERAAPSDASVLISGESGTGKEIIARTLHDKSDRRAGPFVSINCAALPEALLESELFGHTRGAFTDARQAREGLLVRASGGTLFLDEIGEMPIGLQPKLLRALQERMVRPVGADKEVAVDIRVVAASNRDLETAIRERGFREDLYYRINVIHIPVPPLRERSGDVMLLATRFLQRSAERTKSPVRGFTDAAARRMVEYGWPGNVRELANCVERALVLSRGDAIDVSDLPEKVRGRRLSSVPAPDAPGELVSLDEIERRHVLKVLEAVGGNKSHAAQILGLDRKTLYRKLEQYGMISRSTGASSSRSAS